jgi:glycine cleavage system H protein
MVVPEDLLYSSDHEWVQVSGSVIRIGITDYAQDALGDVVFVQLPEVGKSFGAGDGCSEVESTKSVSDIYAPLAGTISAVNSALVDQPELINRDPYGSGWLCEIQLDSGSLPEALSALMNADAYRALTEA